MILKTIFLTAILSLVSIVHGYGDFKEIDVQILMEEISEIQNEPKVTPFCAKCNVGMSAIIDAENATEIVNATVNVCISLGFGNDVFCEELVELHKAEVFYIHQHGTNLTGKDVCGIMFGGYGCETDNPERIWEVTLPDVPKPPVDEPPFVEGMPTMKVLHLTDIHFDPYYYPGADTTNCPEVQLCCRKESGFPVDSDDGAGFWGDYRNCDMPKWTLEALFTNIATTHPDIDFILWTGDLVPVDIWESSREYSLSVINDMADLIYTSFPGIPVFPTVGEHDTSPANLFPQPYITDPEFDISWLYDELAFIWQRWLPEETVSSIAYGAYYSAIVRPGLIILSLNTNYCFGINYWQILDSNDIANQLEWVAQELQKAEDSGNNVYIIGHHSSGDRSCALTWSHEFNKIVSRYENTITGIFYGHTHNDHYQLFFDPVDTNRVYEVAYIAQSLTPYSKLNPGYKIYTIEGDFGNTKYRVLDHENWIMELDTSNAQNQTTFTHLYSAKEAYNLTDLSPQSWLNFAYQMNEPNSTYFEDFYRNFVKAGTPSLEEGCDEECKSFILCRILISDSSDESHCNDLFKHNHIN